MGTEINQINGTKQVIDRHKCSILAIQIATNAINGQAKYHYENQNTTY